MMGRPLTADVLARMRVLLFDHELPAPLVARRLSVSERVVQVYRKQWLAAVAQKLAATAAIVSLADVPDDR